MGNGNGLKQQWGVGDPARAGSDRQSQQFQAAFQKQIATLNGHLQYTSANAEAARHNPLAARRDALYPAFQSALAQIDPTNPTKAQGAIEQVLRDTQALGGEVATFRKEAEKARNDWQARQAKFDAAVHQVEELEGWADAKAPPLRALVDGIRTQVNERRYAPASRTLDELLPKLKPIHDDYLRQKAAKPKYEQALAEQSARLDALKTAERPSQPMTAKAGEADAALQEAKARADAKDFTGGCTQLTTVKAAADALDKLAKDPQRAKFLAARKELEGLLTPPPDPVFKSLEADWNGLGQLRDQSDPLADGGDYAGANKLLTDLKTKHAAFKKKHEKLKTEKAAYDTALAALAPRLQESSQSRYAKFGAMQTDMVTVQNQMEAAAQGDDFVKALALLKDLAAKVDAYLAALKETEQQRTAFEALWTPLLAKLKDLAECVHPRLTPMQQEIEKIRGEVEAAAADGEFEKAQQLAKDLQGKVDLAAQEKAQADKYVGALNAAKADLAVLNGHAQKKHFAAELTALAAQVKAAETKGESGDWDEAIKQAQAAQSKASEIRTAMDMVTKGLTKARAAQVADVSQSLVDAGVDKEKAEEIGQVTNTGGSGDAADAKLVAKELALLPKDVIKSMNAKGTKVVACRGSITDHRKDLKGVTPRGWPPGSTWDSVPGVFLPDTNEVVVATRGHGTAAGPKVPPTGNGHGAFDLAAHESMHGYDHNGGGTAKHADKAFQEARKKDLAKLGPYFTQAGDAGLEETFAESAARFYGGDPKMEKDWPNLYKYWASQPK